MGIMEVLARKKKERETEEFKSQFLENLKAQGAEDSTIKTLSSIKAESPAVLLQTFKNVQDIIAAQKPNLENNIKASSVINQSQQPGGMEQLIEQNPAGLRATEGGVTVEVPSSMSQKIKSAQAKEKKAVAAEEAAKGTYRFLQQFRRSYEELKAFDPSIGDVGFGGYVSKNAAKLATNLDMLPETKVLKADIQATAQEMASELEGGRITNQDRQIQADRFASALNFPTKANIRLMANSYIRLLDKGGDSNGAITNQLKQLIATKTDIFNSVVEQIVVEYPDMAKKIFGEDYEVIE